MKNKHFTFLILLYLITNSVVWASENGPPYIVDEIFFNGCTKTDSLWLESLLITREGEEFEVESYELDLQRLRNLNLFFSVSGDWIVHGNDCVKITIEIKEAIYIYPLIAISGFKDAFKLNLGLSTINWKGRGASLGAVYQYYDRHSLSIYQSTPRHFNGKTGHTLAISKYSTIEPLYFEGLVANFNYDIYSVLLGSHYWLNYHSKLGLGSAYFYEVYKNGLTSIPEFPKSHTVVFRKVQFLTYLDFDYRNFNFEMVDGYHGRIYAEYILDLDNTNYSFYKLEAEIKYYKLLDESKQFALRSKLGIATNRNTAFLPYVIDGYLNVRGVGNRIHRGTALFVNNIEYRQRLIRNKWLIAQAVAFVDVSVIRNTEQKLYKMFNSDQVYSFAGFGGRIVLQKWYTTTFRLDYSHDLTSKKGWGAISFGVDQFF